jgi:RNA polymerase sigma-70 factor (ECF subfamily)
LREPNRARLVSESMDGVDCLPPILTAGSKYSNHLDDDQLIRAAQRGDDMAFEQLVRKYDRAVLRIAVHLTGSTDDGQDIYQEAFLRAYVNLQRFRFECSFYTWIYRIVTNLCLDYLRKKRLRGRDWTITISPDGDEQEVVERVPDQRVGASPEHNFTGRVLREHIIRALGTLSPRERMVFELKHYHGLRLKTVAGILKTTEGTVKSTLFRATHKLRLQLSPVR